MTVRAFINGFGRIGRNVLRAIVESKREDIEIVGINDLGPVETNAHLLRFDSVHGRFPAQVAGGGDTLAAFAAADVTDSFTHVSTAGGAFLEWLEGRDLPGVAILRTSNI